mgnify:CR=1 FL=1|jgi:hypothetical protein|tara:strand:+ start:362 stop:682 length:321 start_codon:yes stop_codon:yes gene_type:complete
MQKFLSIPITATGETAQLVAVDGIVLIEGTTTVVTITYGNAAAQDVVTLTLGAALAANDVSVRDRIQDSVIEALATSWTNPKFDVNLGGLTDNAGAAVTITGIAIA